MKLTLLLLVVFVSTTLASPFYLRGREQRPHRPGGDKSQPEQKQDSSKDREGPCQKAMKHCQEDQNTQRSVEEEPETSNEADEDVRECKEELAEAREELDDAKQRRGLNSDDEKLKKLEDMIAKCEAKIEICAIPKDNPARRALQLLARESESEGTDPCKALDEEMKNDQGDDDEDSEESGPEKISGSEKRKVLRELIHALYSRK